MIVTTAPTIEGKTIGAYLGIAIGEAIVGANIFRDLFANIRDSPAGAPRRMKGNWEAPEPWGSKSWRSRRLRPALTQSWELISTMKCSARITAC
jgi:hypothetical protein